MAGYYDGEAEPNVKEWLAAAKASKNTKIIGIMYTTWENKYDDMEKFMAAVKKYQ
jgi:hypothetical protein